MVFGLVTMFPDGKVVFISLSNELDMEIRLEPLLTLTDIIDGIPTDIEVRQEIVENDTISHITLVQEGKDNHRYDMQFTHCEGKEEPHWQFITDVPKELKEIERTISEAILEKDM